MKVLKYILFVLLGIVALVLIIPVFMSSTYHVERSIEITAPDSLVFAILSDYGMRGSWDPWLEMEPNAKVTYSEPSSGVGATYEWQGEVLGSGSMRMLETVPYKSIKSELKFISPQEGQGIVTWMLDGHDGVVKAAWSIDGDLDYPVGRLLGPMMDGWLGPDLEKGLNNLKKLCEEKAAQSQM